MKLETFFEKFEQFADAPGAVAKMRELILDFAVGGRLLRTSESAEPEAECGWPKQTLGSISSLITKGSTPTSYGHQYEACGIPFVKVENIADGVINHSSMEQFISEATHEFLKRSQLESGDILFSIAGTIGKTCVVSFGDVPANTNQALAIIRGFGASFEIPFLKMQLDSFVANKVKAKARGGAMPNVSLGDLRDLVVVIPPLAEQKRIVVKVDELMALCDRLEAQQQERKTRHAALARASLARFADAPTPANLQFLFHPAYAIPPADLRKSILTLAVQGKLVPQDPSDEPAKDTLATVLRARNSQEKSLRIKEPSAVEANAEYKPDLPSGWCYVSPDQLTAFHKNALTIGPFGSSLLKSDYTDEGVPLVFVRDIRSESFGGSETRFITLDKAEELVSHTVRPGDLLITKMGDPPGDTAIYPEDRQPAIITADCIKLTPHADVVTAEYLRFTIRASQIAEQFAEITLGVAQQKVSLGRFRCIAIPLPPLAEQRRIVAKVEQLMALVDELEMQLVASRATAANLLSALVAELTGTPHNDRLSVPSITRTGRRGEPPKSLD